MMTPEMGNGYEIVLISSQWSAASCQSEENPDGVSANHPGRNRAADAAHYQNLCSSADN